MPSTTLLQVHPFVHARHHTMSSINNTPAAGLTGAPRRARVCAQQTTTCQASSGADWPQQPSKPSSAPNGVVGLWARGVADCGAQGCGVVPDDAFILVRTDNDPPTTHNDVVHALERGITVTGDRQLLLGSQHAKRVNCIIDAPGVAGRHARIELVPGEWDTPLVDSGSQWWGKTLLQQVGLISRQFGSRLYVTDLNSAHGTTVNGVPLVPCLPTELNPGDVVCFGKASSASYRVMQTVPHRSGLPWQRW